METNTINTSSSLNGLKIGGISLSVILGGLLVFSTWQTNRVNKRLMGTQMKKLASEGFVPDDDTLDKAFKKIESISGWSSSPDVTTTANTKQAVDIESSHSFNGFDNTVKNYAAPNIGGGFAPDWVSQMEG